MNSHSNAKRRPRPAQMLYVPPAQRNKRSSHKVVEEKLSNSNDVQDNLEPKEIIVDLTETNEVPVVETIKDEQKNGTEIKLVTDEPLKSLEKKEDDRSLVIMLESLKCAPEKNDIDNEQEEMQRAIVNINRKSRPLIKHVNVGRNDVLHINVEKENKVPTNKLKISSNIESWEDLLNEDDEDINEDSINEVNQDNKFVDDESEDDIPINYNKNRALQDLNHVIELYDFPATFRSQDIMQLYHEVHKDTYLRWCDDTHALLVFSTPAIAQRALHIQHDIIKSRPMYQASSIAIQTASKSDLKPAMKRPQTTMQTARRMITTHLGTKSKISREEQEKEKELLRQARALKLAQKQSEREAWEGNPRPSTA